MRISDGVQTCALPICRTIEFIVPYGPGGGSSLHARLIASLLEQELPGGPTIVIRNVEGGGSVRGLNRFAKRAKPDGMTIAALGTSSYFHYMEIGRASCRESVCQDV